MSDEEEWYINDEDEEENVFASNRKKKKQEESMGVKEWLKLIGMPELFDTFTEEGFDDLEAVAEMTDKDLKAMKIKKRGTRRKVLAKVKALKKTLDKVSEEQEEDEESNLAWQVKAKGARLNSVKALISRKAAGDDSAWGEEEEWEYEEGEEDEEEGEWEYEEGEEGEWEEGEWEYEEGEEREEEEGEWEYEEGEEGEEEEWEYEEGEEGEEEEDTSKTTEKVAPKKGSSSSSSKKTKGTRKKKGKKGGKGGKGKTKKGSKGKKKPSRKTKKTKKTQGEPVRKQSVINDPFYKRGRKDAVELLLGDTLYHNHLPEFDLSPSALKKKKYNPNHAAWLAYACKCVYQNAEDAENVVKNIWGFEHFQFFDNKDTDTQGMAMSNDKCVIVAFRGTQEVVDWITNIKFATDQPFAKYKDVLLHRGFHRAFTSILSGVQEFVRNHKEGKGGVQKPIFLTGHSLGGALANMCFTYFTLCDDPIPVQAVYTIGQPRVGNQALAKLLAESTETLYYRITNNNDVVPGVPGGKTYVHCGERIFISPTGIFVNKPAGWDVASHEIMKELAGTDKIARKGFLSRTFGGLGDHKTGAYLDLILSNYKKVAGVVQLNQQKKKIDASAVLSSAGGLGAILQGGGAGGMVRKQSTVGAKKNK